MGEWHNIGGLVAGGLVYEHSSGATAHWHYENGDVRLVASNLVGGQLELPDREVLMRRVEDDLRASRESEARVRQLLGRNPADDEWWPSVRALLERGQADGDSHVVGACNEVALLALTGIGFDALVGERRGTPSTWTPEALAAFARDYVERGERWSKEHDTWAREQGLSRRWVSQLMEKAEDAGVVVNVAPTRGQGIAKVYKLTGDEPPDRRTRADWHRDRWRTANAKRDALQATIDSGRRAQRTSVPRP